MTTRRFGRVWWWGALLALALAACGEVGRCRLTVRFPDDAARSAVRSLVVYVLSAPADTCDDLISGVVRPGGPDLAIDRQLEIAYPLPGEPPGLDDVPVGRRLFFVEGRGPAGEILLRGCLAATVEGSAVAELTIDLAWVCHPAEEICGNALDDDCDGAIDEDCPTCQSDQDCRDDEPCTIDFCATGACHHTAFPDGTDCDDDDPCTLADGCLDGLCAGTDKNCSALDGPCTAGACDPLDGVCRAVPRVDGTSCEDGRWCTEPDSCSAGTCDGLARDCDDGDPCTRDACDEGAARCTHILQPVPGAEGNALAGTCDNGLDDDCDGFTDTHDANCRDCTSDRDCDDGNPCTTDSCQGLVCINRLLDDGTPCNDELWCSTADACLAGVCSGAPRDCGSAAGPCQEPVCLEAEDRCAAQPAPDGSTCDDGQWCNEPDRCQAGECHSSPRDCDDADSCTLDSCDEASTSCSHLRQPIPGAEGPAVAGSCSNLLDDDCDGRTDGADPDCVQCTADAECDDGDPCTGQVCDAGSCQNPPLTDGAPCDDGRWCTTGDACRGGVCAAQPRDCSAVADACHSGACDEAAAACTARPRADGTPCSDGLWCTEPDRCSAGVCLGQARDCDDSDPCTDDSCAEAAGICEHALHPLPGAEGPPGHGSCSNSLDDDCDGETDLADDDCTECTGAGDCADGNPCTADSCSAGVCQNPALSDGTGCDDGRWCTTQDACQAASCLGHPRDCSAAADACHTADCDEHHDTCIAVQRPEGSACDDGAWCTTADACSAGVCLGQARDCSAWDSSCHVGVCDEGADACNAQPEPDTTPCDDGAWCTTADACSSGVCSGSPRDCDDADVCTLDVCDETNNRCTHTLQPIPGAEGPPGDASCSGALDDDCDGLTDLDDPDCAECHADPHCDDANPCTDDVCAAGLCQNTPLSDGSPCDDGLFCTVPDGCVAGACTGPARDCSGVGGACLEGLCDEGSGSCTAVPLANGTPCDDGAWCTVSDACSGGTCSGSQRDCADGQPCTVDTCDEGSAACLHTFTPRPEEQDLCGDGLDQDCDSVVDGCCGGGQTWTTRATTTIGPNPWSLLRADFNEDGVPDLATVNRGNNTVSVLLGGTGAYTVAHYAVGTDPFGLAAADLNADSILDLAVAANGGDAISVLLGQGSDGRGDGTFGARQDFALGRTAQPCQVVVGDFDGDSIPDLATANWTDNSVAVFLGNGSGGRGTGTFGSPTFYGVGETATNPRALIAADFDSDGILDLAVANWNKGAVSILRGDGADGRGAGSFTVAGRYDAGSSQVHLASADFNSDGVLDLAVVSMNASAVNILPGNGTDGRGDGTFGARTAYATGSTPVSVDPADLDADGILDLVVAEWGTGRVALLPGNGSAGRGDGTFGARSTFAVGTNPSAAVVLEATGDGLPDLAACNNGSSSVSLLAGVGSGGHPDGGFAPFAVVAAQDGAGALAAADLNADAILDLLVVGTTSGTVAALPGGGSNGRGNASFGGGWSANAGPSPRALALGDFDGDRIADLLVSADDGLVRLFFGQGGTGCGDGTFGTPVSWAMGQPAGLAVHDLNTDRLLDLLAADTAGNLVRRLGTGIDGVPDGSLGPPASTPTGSGALRLAIGDLNSDAIPDALVVNRTADTVRVLLGGGSDGVGDGAFSPGAALATADEPVDLVLADFDGDGILDTAIACRSAAALQIRLGGGTGGRGDGTFGAPAAIALPGGPEAVVTGDWNADGLPDLATANGTSGTISLLLGNGDGSFDPPTSLTLGGDLRALATGHFDWDGRVDLAVSDAASGALVVLRGTGSCSPP